MLLGGIYLNVRRSAAVLDNLAVCQRYIEDVVLKITMNALVIKVCDA